MEMKEGSPEHVGALLDEVSEKAPRLIRKLMDLIFSAEAGKNVGAAVGSMYKELISAGIPTEEAIRMSKHYMDSILNMIKNGNVNMNQEPSNNTPKEE